LAFQEKKQTDLDHDPSPRPHIVMAASTIMTLPVVTLFLALERFLEEGLKAPVFGAMGSLRLRDGIPI